MIKIVVAGWRGARGELHGDVVCSGLDQVEGRFAAHPNFGDFLVLSGDNPHGGVDAIVRDYVEGPERATAGWKWESRRHERSERIPGTGTGNYRTLMREGDVDLLVVFPGPNDTDTREAITWAVRYGVQFMGFPLPARTWGGRPAR